MSSLEPLLEKAFDRTPAAQANAQIARVRTEQGSAVHEAVSYELVLDPAADLEAVIAAALPRLVYFLDCRGLKLDRTAGVFVSAFVGDTLYFFHASDFVGALAKVAGLDLEELVKRYGAASG